mgnify:CR=1 FL=1
MIRPIKKNIIVELIEKEKVTEGGIILSRADPAEVNRALVLAVGPEVTEVKEGETILPNWNAAKPSKFDGQDFYIVNEDDVVLIFDEE